MTSPGTPPSLLTKYDDLCRNGEVLLQASEEEFLRYSSLVFNFTGPYLGSVLLRTVFVLLSYTVVFSRASVRGRRCKYFIGLLT
jgi:hypothetical protein